MAYEIDINDPDTLKVNPSPPIPDWFQEKLTELGGRNHLGQPNLRVVWGQAEQVFACERFIPKYRSGVVKEGITKKFRLRNVHTDEWEECSYEEAKARWELCRSENFQDDFIRSEVRVLVELEPVGLPRFVIEQYIPPEKIKDTPENWEANRFKLFSPHALIPQRVTDIIGEFPFEGRYEELLIVKEEDGTRFGKYRALGEDVIEEIRQRLRRRERWKQTKSDQLMVRDVFEDAKRRDELHEKEVAERLKSEMAPHAFRGLYMNQGVPEKMNKRTKHGRAK